MEISQRGIDLIKSFEGCHKKRKDGTIEAYLCPAGVPTIGWGCTKNVKMGMVVTQEQADLMLLKEIAVFEDGVERLVKVTLTQNQFDALVSLAYNIGLGAFGKSTLLRLLNQGNYEAVPAQIMRFRYAAGKVFEGLVRRRRAESGMFRGLSGQDQFQPETQPQPQKVTTPPAPSVIRTAKESGTIKGAVIGLASTAVAAVDGLSGAAKEAVDQAQDFTPLQTLLGIVYGNSVNIALTITAISFAVVIIRRIKAANEGRVP